MTKPLQGISISLLKSTPAADTVAIVHQLSLATAFGGMVFAKAALDPAARVLPDREDRGRMVVAPWRTFLIPAAVALLGGTATWIWGDRSRALAVAPRLAHTKDALLAACIATGAINAAAGLKLSRSGSVPMENGARPAAGSPVARTHLTGVLSGYAHLVALAATIGIGAVLARRLTHA